MLTDTHPTQTFADIPHTCSPYLLPSGGVVVNPVDKSVITLQFEAVFEPPCPTVTIPLPLDPLQTNFEPEDLLNGKPFSSSTSPQIYAISAATIVSYMLVVILFVTPRTFYVGGAGGGVSLLGRRGTLGGSYGSNTVIGIGSRPWMQKIAAITLATSLTIVTVDTFSLAENQYDEGYADAGELSRKVLDGLEIRIVRLISETFVWLAQAQTLIRLFQRRREKLVIKWTAFVLITLEVIFSIMDHFVEQGSAAKPKTFDNSMQALNYLFALSLNIAYAAFVIVYCLRKRRFAFFHSQMRSMPLMALLSLTAVLIPVIFFILDLSQPDISGWGSYVRWVAACAASVVVWEWVERIEALEREEKRDGILGREIFDGDEMLDANPPRRGWPNHSQGGKKRGGSFGGGFASSINTRWSDMTKVAKRFGKPKTPEPVALKGLDSDSSSSSHRENKDREADTIITRTRDRPNSPAANVASLVNRADTTSAASNLYRVRRHSGTEPTVNAAENMLDQSSPGASQRATNKLSLAKRTEESGEVKVPPRASRLSRIPIPFRRQRQTPPAVVTAAIAGLQTKPATPGPKMPSSLLDRMHLTRHHHPVAMPSSVIVVPAPPGRLSNDTNPEGVEGYDANEHFDGDDDDDDDSENDDEERPPAAVRHALRMSNQSSPVDERELSMNAQWQSSMSPAPDEALNTPGVTQPGGPSPSTSHMDRPRSTNLDPL